MSYTLSSQLKRILFPVLFFAFIYCATAQVITLHGHFGPVTSGTFSPDGKLVRTTGDSSVCAWDVTTGKLLSTNFFDSYDGIDNIMYSANGKRFAFAFRLPDFSRGNYDEYIAVYDSAGDPVNTITYNNLDWESFLLSPDGEKIAVELSGIPEDEGGIKNVSTGLSEYYNKIGFGPIAFSGDGKLLAVNNNYQQPSSKRMVIIYSTDSAKIKDSIVTSSNIEYGFRSIYFDSSDSKLILTNNTHAYIWNQGSDTVLDSIPLGNTYSISVPVAFFSPNDSLICTTGGDSTVTIWDASILSPLYTIRFSGTSLASVFIPGFGNSTKENTPACFSPDGTRIFTVHTDNTVLVWNAKTGKLLHTLAGHTEPITSASWDPSGTHILTTSADSTAKIWGPTYTSLSTLVSDYPPTSAELAMQLFPNPAATNITIGFQLPSSSITTITIFNILGNQMLPSVNGMERSGYHTLPLDIASFPNGVYIIQLRSGEQRTSSVLRVMR